MGCAKMTVSNRCRFTCKHDKFALSKIPSGAVPQPTVIVHVCHNELCRQFFVSLMPHTEPLVFHQLIHTAMYANLGVLCIHNGSFCMAREPKGVYIKCMFDARGLPPGMPVPLSTKSGKSE
jgi:hypothetical protein